MSEPQNGWQPIETAPRDREILCVDESGKIRVCYAKLFPRPIHDPSAREAWEYHRHYDGGAGHTWSMCPTHWMELPEPPEEKQ